MTDFHARGAPLLTVVTVCLNRADMIASAIESVLAQGSTSVGGVDVEHLVIDGGSTDGTPEVVASYPSVRFVSEPDSGLYDAMNKGIRLARGRYLVFLNSDDELALGVVAKVRPFMLGGVDVVCVGTDIRRRRPGECDEVIEMITSPHSIALTPLTATLGSPLLNAKFMRRGFVVESAGSFDLRYRLAADAELLLRAALSKPSLTVLPIVGHHYVEHAGSLTINRGDTGGRLAAEECIAIAEVMLRKPGLAYRTRNLMRAWRGGKIMAITRLDRRTARNASSWFWALMRSRDVGRYACYLIGYKLGVLRW